MVNLRKAAEMALERLESHEYWMDEKAIKALRQALTQPVDAVNMKQECVDETAKREHEPEWIDDGFGTMWQKCGKKDCGKFVVKIGKVDCWNGDCPETNAPPKREWVGLTKDEIEEIADWSDKNAAPWYLEYARAIEAKLKEKNGVL